MIKVIIERRVAEGLEQPYEKCVSEALQFISDAPGFVSGESLKDTHSPNHHVIISTWRSANAWQKWLGSEKRKFFMEQILPLLTDEEKLTILEPARKSTLTN